MFLMENYNIAPNNSELVNVNSNSDVTNVFIKHDNY